MKKIAAITLSLLTMVGCISNNTKTVQEIARIQSDSALQHLIKSK